MLITVAEHLTKYYTAFNVFSYLTTRAIMSALTALVLSFAFGPALIQKLTLQKIGQQIRDVGPESHQPKAGTPTMGGALILIAIAISTVLWANLSNRFVWIALIGTLFFGVIGFVDDYKKLIVKNSRGLSASSKFFWQVVGALGAAFAFYFTADNPDIEHALLIPYLKNVMLPLGTVLYLTLVTFVVAGFSNAVNLTDGLDGLAIMPAVLVSAALGVFAYAAGNVIYSNYLGIPYVVGSGELLVFCAALAGAGLGFLGSTPIPRKSSWATSVLSHSVPLLGLLRWRCGKNWCFSSWAGCSSSKPSQSSSRLPPTRLPAGAFFAWPHCTITSSSRVGLSRR